MKYALSAVNDEFRLYVCYRTQHTLREEEYMGTVKQFAKHSLRVVVSAATILFAGYSGLVSSNEVKVTLSGDQEIPPLTTSASGTGTITVAADKSVSGNATISGMSVTVAHIHEAAAGNGRFGLFRFSNALR